MYYRRCLDQGVLLAFLLPYVGRRKQWVGRDSEKRELEVLVKDTSG